MEIKIWGIIIGNKKNLFFDHQMKIVEIVKSSKCLPKINLVGAFWLLGYIDDVNCICRFQIVAAS